MHYTIPRRACVCLLYHMLLIALPVGAIFFAQNRVLFWGFCLFVPLALGAGWLIACSWQLRITCGTSPTLSLSYRCIWRQHIHIPLTFVRSVRCIETPLSMALGCTYVIVGVPGRRFFLPALAAPDAAALAAFLMHYQTQGGTAQ